MKFIVEAVVEVGRAVAVGNESTTGLGLQMCAKLECKSQLVRTCMCTVACFFFLLFIYK